MRKALYYTFLTTLLAQFSTKDGQGQSTPYGGNIDLELSGKGDSKG